MHDTGVAGDPASRVHRLDPRAKIAGLGGITLVGVSTPPRYWPVLAVCALALAAIAAVGRIGPGVIWSRAKVVLPSASRSHAAARPSRSDRSPSRAKG
jgi:cobalt/nickel transport system permease protein